MLKKPAGFSRHWALTGTRPPHISTAFTSVTRFIQRIVNLTPVRKHEATYSSLRAPRDAQSLSCFGQHADLLPVDDLRRSLDDNGLTLRHSIGDDHAVAQHGTQLDRAAMY